jgi:hypothetical protein
MTDLSAYTVDAVNGLVLRNGPPPGANGSGGSSDRLAALAALSDLISVMGNPEATQATLADLSRREAEVDRRMSELSARESRASKREQALEEKAEALRDRGLNLQKEYTALEAFKLQARREHDQENADQANAAACWASLCDMVQGGINPRDAMNAGTMVQRETAAALIEMIRGRAPRVRPASELHAEKLVAEADQTPFPEQTTITGGGRAPKPTKRERL